MQPVYEKGLKNIDTVVDWGFLAGQQLGGVKEREAGVQTSSYCLSGVETHGHKKYSNFKGKGRCYLEVLHTCYVGMLELFI